MHKADGELPVLGERALPSRGCLFHSRPLSAKGRLLREAFLDAHQDTPSTTWDLAAL